jgi:D-serine dehydratase
MFVCDLHCAPLGSYAQKNSAEFATASQPDSSKLLALSRLTATLVTKVMEALVALKTSFNDLTRFTLLDMINSEESSVLDASNVGQPPRSTANVIGSAASRLAPCQKHR